MNRAGLRLQIVLAVCGLMTLAFVPLFFAVASLTRVALHGAEVEASRSLGRAVAAHAADLPSPDHATLERLIAHTNVTSLCVFGPDGASHACGGEPMSTPPQDEHGAIDVRVPRTSGLVVARVRAGHDEDRAAPFVRLYAGYTTAFALVLAFAVYVVLTRLIVRPVEALARATDRVASGARTLDVPAAGAREIELLSESVSAMTARLIADEETLRKKVDELTEAQAQIVRSERMASVGRLAAGMAHEIGNPITAIMGIQDLMLAGDVPPPEQADYLTRMRKETDRVHRILRDLLDFARPETGSQPLGVGEATSIVTANVATAMNDIASLLKPQKQFRDVAIVVESPNVDESAAGGTSQARTVEARIGPERLTQVLLNLALNAGDAMEADPQGARHLVLRARVAGKVVRIEVEDTGPGVSRDVHERLFLPFVTTKEVGQGTGLGLAVCRGIVEAAGGHIELDETYTQGARFVIELPLA
jgi:signal transduction histidine kinase